MSTRAKKTPAKRPRRRPVRKPVAATGFIVTPTIMRKVAVSTIAAYLIFVVLSLSAGYYAYVVSQHDTIEIRANQATTDATARLAAELSQILAHNQVAGHDSQVKECIGARDRAARVAAYDTFKAQNDALVYRDLVAIAPAAAKDFLARSAYENALSKIVRDEVIQRCDIPFINPVRERR